VIAGVVSTDDPDRSAQALSLFEQARGTTAYGVAAACGFGRNKAAEAEQGAATIASLVRAPEGSRG
jgi:predicted negative regulator of RcsB-dependent stress response